MTHSSLPHVSKTRSGITSCFRDAVKVGKPNGRVARDADSKSTIRLIRVARSARLAKRKRLDRFPLRTPSLFSLVSEGIAICARQIANQSVGTLFQLSTFRQVRTRMARSLAGLAANQDDSGDSSMHRWLRLIVVGVLIGLIGQSSSAFGQRRKSASTADREQDAVARPAPKQMTDEELIELKRREMLVELAAQTSLDRGASIHPKLMETVQDNSIGVRFEEREAYLRTLQLAQEVPLSRLRDFADQNKEERRDSTPAYSSRKWADFPQFVDLFTHPNFYRGRPVTIQGVMRKLTKFDLGQNRYDLEQAYEGWVYPADSQGNPVVVVFTSKDERLPVNGDIQEEVRFTGYFFKMYGYDAHDMTRKAPLILAGEVEPTARSHRAAYQPIRGEWYLLTAFVFLLGCYTVWAINRREMPARTLSQIEPDFRHFPPQEYPATDRLFPHAVIETEDA